MTAVKPRDTGLNLGNLAAIMDKVESIDARMDRIEVWVRASDRLVAAVRGMRDLDFGLFPGPARMRERQKAEQAVLDALTDYEAAVADTEEEPR